MRLLRYGKPIGSIFGLLGKKEDDMTYALGYVVSCSPNFVVALADALGHELTAERVDGVVHLQEADSKGRTDVEIHIPGELSLICEAKRGPELPSEAQLGRYASRLKKAREPFVRLVTVSNATPEFARAFLPRKIDGIQTTHVSWRQLRDVARSARTTESHSNKRLLDEFCTYLSEILGMETRNSNMVYVVSLSRGSEWGIGYREVVEKRRQYFYPVGGPGGWPSPPPNYVAFRYDGRLQSIHHVKSYRVFKNPADELRGAENCTIAPCYLLDLGTPIKPDHEVKNGPSIQRSNRVWCMIDTLLTCTTITDALKETKRRQRQ